MSKTNTQKPKPQAQKPADEAVEIVRIARQGETVKVNGFNVRTN
jgi:hypothetical protein